MRIRLEIFQGPSCDLAANTPLFQSPKVFPSLLNQPEGKRMKMRMRIRMRKRIGTHAAAPRHHSG